MLNVFVAAKPNPVQRVEVVALNSTTAQLNITAEDSGTLNFSITYYATSGQNGSITVSITRYLLLIHS